MEITDGTPFRFLIEARNAAEFVAWMTLATAPADTVCIRIIRSSEFTGLEISAKNPINTAMAFSRFECPVHGGTRDDGSTCSGDGEVMTLSVDALIKGLKSLIVGGTDLCVYRAHDTDGTSTVHATVRRRGGALESRSFKMVDDDSDGVPAPPEPMNTCSTFSIDPAGFCQFVKSASSSGGKYLTLTADRPHSSSEERYKVSMSYEDEEGSHAGRREFFLPKEPASPPGHAVPSDHDPHHATPLDRSSFRGTREREVEVAFPLTEVHRFASRMGTAPATRLTLTIAPKHPLFARYTVSPGVWAVVIIACVLDEET